MTSQILLLDPQDSDLVRALVSKEWGDDFIIVHHDIFYPHNLPGFKAVEDETLTGLITYRIFESACEIITLNSFRQREGIGTALLKSVEAAAMSVGCQSYRLVTTNNNLNALEFYQKRGFSIQKVDFGAVNEARKRKPSIPFFDENGLPIQDEVTLVKMIA